MQQVRRIFAHLSSGRDNPTVRSYGDKWMVVHPRAGPFRRLSSRVFEGGRTPIKLYDRIIQSENLRTLRLVIAGDQTSTIIETKSRTKVQSNRKYPFRNT